MLIKKNNKVVFFGDSLTNRSGIRESVKPARRYSLDYSGSYVDILLKKILVRYPELEIEAYNKGVGGNTVIDLLNRINEDVLKLEPDWVVLFIGQNDATKGFTAEEFKANLIKLLDIFKKNGVKIIQLSTTPKPNPMKEMTNHLLDEYDVVIEDLCQQYGNSYVDVKRCFKHIQQYNLDTMSPVSLFNDGCHLSELGNILIAEFVLDVMMCKI